jgi:hypothetical protein
MAGGEVLEVRVAPAGYTPSSGRGAARILAHIKLAQIVSP